MLSATLADVGVAHGGDGTRGRTENWHAVPTKRQGIHIKEKGLNYFACDTLACSSSSPIGNPIPLVEPTGPVSVEFWM